MPARKKVNLKELSRLSGFSLATVSNALHNKKGVRPETARQIVELAKKTGYIPPSGISRVRFVVYRRPGSVVVDNPFFSLVLQGAEEQCREAGVEMLLTYLDINASNYRKELQTVLDDQTSGILLLGCEMELGELPHFKAMGVPLVLIDHWDDDMEIECVLNDQAGTVRMLVQHLVAMGHSEIGHLKGNLEAFSFSARESALKKNLARLNIPLKQEHVFAVPAGMAGAYAQMAKYLRAGRALPTAFVADNDAIALGCMQAFKEAGLNIPGDISVVGIDNMPASAMVEPGLTSVEVETTLLGQTAAKKIIAAATGGEAKSSVVYATRLVQRGSVAKIWDKLEPVEQHPPTLRRETPAK